MTNHQSPKAYDSAVLKSAKDNLMAIIEPSKNESMTVQIEGDIVEIATTRKDSRVTMKVSGTQRYDADSAIGIATDLSTIKNACRCFGSLSLKLFKFNDENKAFERIPFKTLGIGKGSKIASRLSKVWNIIK